MAAWRVATTSQDAKGDADQMKDERQDGSHPLGAGGAGDGGSGALLQRLRMTPVWNRQRVLLDQVVGIMHAMLGPGSAGAIRPDQKLFELGFRSLDLVEFRARLESAYGVELPVTLFFSYSSLETLTGHLLGEVLGLEGGPPARRSGGAAFTPLEVAQLHQMTEEEADARLLEKIVDLEEKLLG